MLRKSSLIVVVLVASFLVGCSDSKPRKAGRKLLKQVTQAQRLYDRAAGLLADVPFKVGENVAPVFKDVSGDAEVTLLPTSQLNPQAVEDLQKAEDILRKALSEYANDAKSESVSLARRALGRVKSLRGYTFAFKASAARQDLMQSYETFEDDMQQASSQLMLVSYLQKLQAMSNEDVKKMLSQAKSRINQMQQKVSSIDQTTQTLKSRRDQLLKEARNLSKKAREFRRKADTARGEESLELFDTSQKYEKQAGEKRFAAKKVEQKIDAQAFEASQAKSEIANAQQKQSVAESVVSERSRYAESHKQTLREVLARMNDARSDAESQLAKMGSASGELAEFENAAISAYEEAAESFDKAEIRSQRDAALLGAQASANMSIGAIQAASRQTRELNQRIAQRVQKLWNAMSRDVPAAGEELKSYAANIDEAQKSAAEAYQKAVDLYQDAERAADRDVQWIYQAHQAGALYALATLQDDAGKMQGAREAIAEALEDKRESPNVDLATQIEKMISEESNQ